MLKIMLGMDEVLRIGDISVKINTMFLIVVLWVSYLLGHKKPK